jgi:hypothetical protein
MKEIKLVQFELKAGHGCFEKIKKCADLHTPKEVEKKQASILMQHFHSQLNLKNSKSAFSIKQIFSINRTLISSEDKQLTEFKGG